MEKKIFGYARILTHMGFWKDYKREWIRVEIIGKREDWENGALDIEYLVKDDDGKVFTTFDLFLPLGEEYGKVD